MNDLNEKLMSILDSNTEKGYIVTKKTNNIMYLRFVICNHTTTKKHVKEFFDFMQESAAKCLKKNWKPISKLKY